MRKLFIFFFLLSSFCLNAQIQKELKITIDTLCSPYFAGRGYVDKGCLKAANYLIAYFQSIGIEDKNTVQQNYHFSVNTFPGNIQVVINDTIRLRAGIDFLVDAASNKAHFDKRILKRIALDKIQNRDGIKLAFNSLDEKKYAFILDSLDIAVKKLGIKKDDILSLLPEGLFIIPSTKKLIWDVSNDNYKASIIHVQSEMLNETSISIKVNIDQKLKLKVKQKNIVAIIPGNCDSILVFSAHYDHLGKMGNEVYFPGASDNASGTSLMLSLANYYKQIENNKYTMVFIAFSGEEAGLLGSQYFVDHPLVNLKKIKFLTNIDIAGDATNGITVVNGSVFKNQFDLLNTVNNEANLLPEIRSRGKAPISDHYFFSEKNIPCFFIYTNGGKGYYHDIFDHAKELSLNNIDGLYNLLIQFYNKL
ncbi:MAG: hypothetical protein RIQ61_114 [Bacteroidota bacterium]|jgi:hypothetical protein